MALVVSSPSRARRGINDETNVTLHSTPFKPLAQQLPTELISLVASYLVPQIFIPSQMASASNSSNLTELVRATHVCQSWRVAISNDPRLWTKIELCDILFPGPLDFDMFAQFLTLSGSLSLDIAMDFVKGSNVCIKMLDKILENSTRCAVLSLSLSRSLFAEFIRNDCAFPNLRRLTLLPNPNRMRIYPSSSEKLWRRLPRLEVLELVSDMTECICSLPPNGCFQNLNDVIIDLVNIFGDASHIFFSFIDTLASSDTITSVTFNATCCKAESDLLSRDPVGAVNTRIKNLHVRNYGVRLLHHMTLPSLRNLSVDTLRWDIRNVPAVVVTGIMPCISGFLDRSSPPLERFTLARRELTRSILPSLFQYLRGVTTFSLHVHIQSSRGFLTEFFDELSKNNNGTFAVLSRLKRLAIRLNADRDVFAAQGYDEYRRIEEIDGEHFVSMIRERTSHSDSPLRYVAVIVEAHTSFNLVDSDVEALKQCGRRIEGLKVIVTDAGSRL